MAAGRREESRGPLDFRPDAYSAWWEALDRLTTAVVYDALERLEVWDGLPVDAGRLVESHEVVLRYRSLVARWLARLGASGVLESSEGGWVRVAVPDPPLEVAWAEAETALGDDGAYLATYLRRCHEALPEVLRGRRDPLETLFPDGSTETADQLYSEGSLVRYYNQLLRAAFVALLESSPRPLRVLEVGAGTGGTTSVLLPEARGRIREYLFTDVTGGFFPRAEERFAAYDFLRCETLDLDGDPFEQGLPREAFDVVVAANVLHATRDLPTTLRRLRGMMAPGGVLLALEITRDLSWFDVSTALLEGW